MGLPCLLKSKLKFFTYGSEPSIRSAHDDRPYG